MLVNIRMRRNQLTTAKAYGNVNEVFKHSNESISETNPCYRWTKPSLYRAVAQRAFEVPRLKWEWHPLLWMPWGLVTSPAYRRKAYCNCFAIFIWSVKVQVTVIRKRLVFHSTIVFVEISNCVLDPFKLSTRYPQVPPSTSETWQELNLRQLAHEGRNKLTGRHDERSLEFLGIRCSFFSGVFQIKSHPEVLPTASWNGNAGNQIIKKRMQGNI